MGGLLASHPPLKPAGTHQRTPSASTINSNGPTSPDNQLFAFPYIANPDPPLPQYQYPCDDDAKPFAAAQRHPRPSGLGWETHPVASQPLMQDLSWHFSREENPPDFCQQSQSMSSHGNNTPNTPRSGTADQSDSKAMTVNQGETAPRPHDPQREYSWRNDADAPHTHTNPTLLRTDASQGPEGDFIHPGVSYPVAPVQNKPSSDWLSPHRKVLSQRLQTAQAVRSTSPTSLVRPQSPFRDGSPFARTWQSPPDPAPIQTTATMRQQQRQEAAEREIKRSQQKREPTKTMSPQEALLDYHESEPQPLFQDSIPVGYRQHAAGVGEPWQNDFSIFGGNLAPATTVAPPLGGFRPGGGENDLPAQMNFMSLPPHDAPPAWPNAPYVGPKLHFGDATPDFPATLTSMESSVSESGPPDALPPPPASLPRPSDTRAHTGTYSCTYHGCSQRFEQHHTLINHKRAAHRAQPPPHTSPVPPSAASPGSAPPSPSGTAGAATTDTPPSPTTSPLILARNAQAGPHKCTRLNPSTLKPCNTLFSRPYDLTRHEDTIHAPRKHKVRCELCRDDKTFSRHDALTRHMRIVHPDDGHGQGHAHGAARRGRRD